MLDQICFTFKLGWTLGITQKLRISYKHVLFYVRNFDKNI